MQPPYPRLARIMSLTMLPRPRTRLGVRLFKYVPHSSRNKSKGGGRTRPVPPPPPLAHSLPLSPPSLLDIPGDLTYFFLSCLVFVRGARACICAQQYMASVPFGFVLVRVRVRVLLEFIQKKTHEQLQKYYYSFFKLKKTLSKHLPLFFFLPSLHLKVRTSGEARFFNATRAT
jgi:hypothetical protein